MQITSSRRFTPMLLLFAILATGCGPSNPLGRVSVSGKVTLDDSPLEQGSIQFEAQSGGRVNSGAIIQNGDYSIPVENGLPPGKYLVRIDSAEKTAAGSNARRAPGPEDTTPNKKSATVAPAYNTASKEVVEVPGNINTLVLNFSVKSK